jgi:hypothetical protein
MNVLKDVLEELWSMFAGDRRLTVLTLVVVAISATVAFLARSAVLSALLLLVGALAVLTDAVLQAARRARS